MTDRADELKQEIFRKVEEYYREVHRPHQRAPFDPGKTSVRYAGRVFDEREMIALVDSALDFWLTSGPYTRRFEKDLAAYLGSRWALFVNSGSSANLLAFMALTSPLLGERRIHRGDEVITVAAGFPTTVAPIVQYGAVPVFVDVEPRTANLDPSLLEAALSPRTRAVMLAHTLGNPFDLDAVTAFCRRHGLWLIEDNCDALGSEYRGRKTGTFGDIGTSSFYPPHHMTTGEGGAVYTDDPLLKKILLSMRDWGRDCWCESGVDNTCGRRFSQRFGSLPYGYDHKYVYSHFGYNLKATDLQAAIGVAQLQKLEEFTHRRRENFRFLFDRLRSLEGLLQLPQSLPEADPSWFGFLIQLKQSVPFSRNDLVRYLEDHGIQTRNLFGGNLLRQPLFSDLEEGRDYRVISEMTHTDRFMNDAFWLGLYPGMDETVLGYVADTIHEFCAPYLHETNPF